MRVYVVLHCGVCRGRERVCSAVCKGIGRVSLSGD